MEWTATSSPHRAMGNGEDDPVEVRQSSVATLASSSQQQYPRRRDYELLVVAHNYHHEDFDPNKNTHQREPINTIGVAVGISKDTGTWSGADYPLELWWRDAASIAPAVYGLTDTALMGYVNADSAESARNLAHNGAGYLRAAIIQDITLDTSQFTVHSDQESFDDAVKDGERLTAETGINSHDVLISVDRVPDPDWRVRLLRFKDTPWVNIRPFLYKTDGEGALPDTLPEAVERLFTKHHRSQPEEEHFTHDALTSPASALHHLMHYVGHWPMYRRVHSVFPGASTDDGATIERLQGETLTRMVQSELNDFVAINEDVLGKDIRFKVLPGQQVDKNYQDMRAIVASRPDDTHA